MERNVNEFFPAVGRQFRKDVDSQENNHNKMVDCRK